MSTPKPTKITITIGATKAKPHPPTLEDDSAPCDVVDQKPTTCAKVGDTIIWKKSGDITKINHVSKTSGDDVFSTNPTNQSDDTWKAIVGNFKNDMSQEYSINYTVNKPTLGTYSVTAIMKIKPPHIIGPHGSK